MAKRLIIDNVRLFPATNSSSSHSFIILPNAPQDTLYTVYDTYDDNGNEKRYGEFGWQDFTLTEREDKRLYLAQSLYEAFKSEFPEDMAVAIIRHLTGDDLHNFSPSDGYVDHQSVMTFPADYHHPTVIDRAFVQAFIAWLDRPDVVILGGNDNEEPHPLSDNSFEVLPVESTQPVTRYDPLSDSWTLFWRDSGHKMRIRFADDKPAGNKRRYNDHDDMPIERLSAPELVDIKITSQCPFVTTAACGKYCYQGSVTEGVHANYGMLLRIFYELGQLKVFEVALGGGEPTVHPDFARILSMARFYGIVPNFTTRNLAWLADAAQREEILSLAGAFAYSAHSVADIHRLGKALAKHKVGARRANLHIVMGTMNKAKFTDMLRAADSYRLRATLLGYKATGHGVNYSPVDYSWWLDVIKELHEQHVYPNVSIDTTLAEQSKQMLEAAGVSNKLYFTQEGRFSAYIDAVGMTFAPSSYGGAGVRVDRETFDADWLKTEFAKFP